MVKVCLGDGKVLRVSVWKARSDGSNPRSNRETESKIRKSFTLNTFHCLNCGFITELLWICFGGFITNKNLPKSTLYEHLKKSQAAVLSTFKSRFGGESRFCNLEPGHKQIRLVLCAFALLHVCLR